MANVNENIRYEPEERPPHLLCAGLGLQATATLMAPIVVTVAIIMRAANQPDSISPGGILCGNCQRRDYDPPIGPHRTVWNWVHTLHGHVPHVPCHMCPGD